MASSPPAAKKHSQLYPISVKGTSATASAPPAAAPKKRSRIIVEGTRRAKAAAPAKKRNIESKAEAPPLAKKRKIESEAEALPLRSRRPPQPWMPAEEQLLEELKAAGQSWNDIVRAFPTRSMESVKGHWEARARDTHFASPWNQGRRKNWTPGEEQRLKQMKDAGDPWDKITKVFPNRTKKALQAYWNGMKQARLSKEMTVLGPCNADATATKAALAAKKVITDRRVRTRWRHAMRHPLLIAYRKKVEAMDHAGFKLFHEDRLKEIDEIGRRGTLEQKKKCLKNITDPKTGILPRFYSARSKDGMRYPGDGGLDPQVETDHESVEGEDITTEPQEAYVPNRPRRGRHRENRRHTDRLWKKNNMEKVRAKRARWALRRKAREDHDISGAGSTITGHNNLAALGAALGREWPLQQSFLKVINRLQRIRDGKDAEASLLLLDLEFIASSRRVLEIALGEFNSGKVLLDVRVDNECTKEELLTKPDGRPIPDPSDRIRGLKSLTSVYGSVDPRKCSGKRTASEIAEMIINAGVTRESIILVWHTSTFDLDLLRELLESAGYDNILPPTENCIPMINHFRPGLPGKDKKTGKAFTTKLDMLFPLLFARHELVGKNHRALPDIMILRLMILLLIQLQKPPLERDLAEFPTTTREFVRSARVPYTILEDWLGIPLINQIDIEQYAQDDESTEDEDGEGEYSKGEDVEGGDGDDEADKDYDQSGHEIEASTSPPRPRRRRKR